MNQELLDGWSVDESEAGELLCGAVRTRPILITETLLKQVTGYKKTDIGLLVRKLNEAMMMYEINTLNRASHFLGQITYESGCFNQVIENLNYTEKRLLQVFPKYFNASNAKEYAGHPQKIANRVYGGKYGNGPEWTGDGWKYRGRGYIQLTFKSNYEKIGKFLNYDFVSKPDDLTKISCAVFAAAAYWVMFKINDKADRNDYTAVCKAVNGGTNGLSERKRWTDKWRKALS